MQIFKDLQHFQIRLFSPPEDNVTKTMCTMLEKKNTFTLARRTNGSEGTSLWELSGDYECGKRHHQSQRLVKAFKHKMTEKKDSYHDECQPPFVANQLHQLGLK